MNIDKAVKAGTHMESNVRVFMALRCPGKLTVNLSRRLSVPQCHMHGQGPVGQGQGLILKAKAKDLTIKAKAKAKDSKCVLEDTSRPRTKAKDNNTDLRKYNRSKAEILHVGRVCWKADVYWYRHF